MTVLFLALFALSARAAETPDCGDRLLAYTVYEEFEDGEIKEKISTYPVEGWSDASAFKGLVTRQGKGLALEIELIHGKFHQKSRFAFAPWEKDKSYFVAEGFQAEKFFENAESGDSFILRLKRKDKAVCEDDAREVADE